MMKKESILFSIIFLTLGILIGYFSTEYPLFTIKYEIDIVAVLSILATILLGFYLSEILQNKQSNSRIEKDLIIGKLNLLSEEIEKLQIVNNQSNLTFSNTVSFFKKLNNDMFELINSIDIIQLKIDSNLIKSVKDDSLALKKMCTNAMKRDEFFFYTDENVNDIMLKRTEIKRAIFKLTVNINRM